MKLSIVVPVFNQFPLTTAALDSAVNNLSGEREIELVVLDNGSDNPYEYKEPAFTHPVEIKNIRLEKNIGVYPTFWEGLKHTTGDVVAFFHSDLVILEPRWDLRLIQEFEADNWLGLVGFIGSNEIDGMGGRGLGTVSNFMGNHIMHQDMNGNYEWSGSAAEIHGRRDPGFTPAAVVDGCAMVFKTGVLKAIKQRANFPPHHFYDRLLSCEVIEQGYKVGVLGIACDHISGQTVNQENGYGTMAEEWANAHGISKGDAHNWDTVLYKHAEKLWLTEYRDSKHIVPKRV